VDVGGTKILGGVIDDHGTIVEEVRVTSPATDPDAIQDAIASVVLDLKSRHEIATVGVGAAGYIDKARRTVMFAPTIAWRDVDLADRLETKTELSVVIENDGNAAAWGEFAFGAGADVDDMLMVTVGTGIGGGLVLDGELYRGAFGVGGEIGHMRVVPGGIECGCGKLGCFEKYASGSALVQQVRAGAATDARAAALIERAGGTIAAINGPMVTELARSGDAFCVDALATLGTWLGEGIASLTAVLDPAVVAVSGGVADADALLLEPTRTAFQAQLTGRGFRPELEIRKASLGNRAGLVGAADLGRH
jgi:glucokinase